MRTKGTQRYKLCPLRQPNNFQFPIFKFIDLHVPVVSFQQKQNDHRPWFDKELINNKNKTDNARKRIKTEKMFY